MILVMHTVVIFVWYGNELGHTTHPSPDGQNPCLQEGSTYVSATCNARESYHLQDEISQKKSLLDFQESRLAVFCSAASNVI
jgi:hypothetical protein